MKKIRLNYLFIYNFLLSCIGFTIGLVCSLNTKDIQYTYYDAKVVDTQYATSILNNSYVVVVKNDDENIPENRIKIKTDNPVYKLGDNVVVGINQHGYATIGYKEDMRMSSTDDEGRE